MDETAQIDLTDAKARGQNWLWKWVAREVASTHIAIEHASEDLKKMASLGIDDAFTVAASEVLMHRSRLRLTWIAVVAIFFACALGGATFFLLIYFALELFHSPLPELVDNSLSNSNWPKVTLLIVRTSATAALFLFAGVFALQICRALLHEANVSFQRLHSLRFGQLYVYLRGRNVPLEELDQAFQWHKEHSSFFARPESERKQGPSVVSASFLRSLQSLTKKSSRKRKAPQELASNDAANKS